MRVTIGIHVWDNPGGLRKTLETIARTVITPYRIQLLGDGADAQTSVAMAATRLPQSSTAMAQGAAACFNRLTQSLDSDVFVLLENGCLPANGWLEELLEAFARDGRTMLAGPSTNACWNEQSGYPYYDLARTRKGEFRSLEPLHSLAEFCFAVRRELVETIGGADERYGLGPCWEMDYNIRAARAGFRGVWACGSFVFRPGTPARKTIDEARLFESGKHLYQDKFCGLRLAPRTGGQQGLAAEPRCYEAHCRGEECEHFAPAQLIQIEMNRSQAGGPEPLVSCVMVTRGRPAYVAQSIRYFMRQTWKNRELVVVYDEASDLPVGLPTEAEGVRAFRLPGRKSIGAKRNYGCEHARGEILVQWDDDDWYGADRLRIQAEPIQKRRAEITAFRTALFLELQSWRFWTCADALHARMFVRDVHGGTLAYSRAVLEKRIRYPETNLAEDASFLEDAMRSGARLERITTPGLFIYLRHDVNSWKFRCGEFTDPQGWRVVPEPEYLEPEDRAFYASRSARPPASRDAAPAMAAPRNPLVTCIMPTADRARFIPRAIEYFQRQHYPERELLILDDGRTPVEHLVPGDDARIRYVRLKERRSIGAKRNLACAMARGEVILHWDDDDWMAEWRISYQVQALLRAPERSVCGLNRVLYFDARHERAWMYVYPPDAPPWLSGNTLCYWKQVAADHPFPEINDGEDTRFVWSLPQDSLVAHPDPTFFVAMIHDSNASPKMTADRRWQMHPTQDIHRIMQIPGR